MISANNSTDIEYKLDFNHQSLSREVCIFLAIVLILAFCVGTVGNITVLALYLKYKSLRTASNLFVINLTIADLLMCIICLPMLINEYIRSQVVDSEFIEKSCLINTFLGAFIGFLSIWSLVCLAFDRCIVITRTMPVRQYSNKSFSIYVIIGLWVFCLIAAAIPFSGYGRYVLEGQTTSCESKDTFTLTFQNVFYNIMIQVLFFVVPVICITYCYFVIYMKVRNHEKTYFSTRKSGQFDEVSFRRMRKNRTLEKKEMKTARAGIILISVFCFSWTPFSVVSWIALFGNRDSLTPIAVALPSIFAKITTILNPLLYALLLPSFKSKLALFCKNHFHSPPSSFGSNERDRNIPYTFGSSSHLQRTKTIVVFGTRDRAVITAV
ncbi:melanopsin-A-like [Ruditapes philippinarum]|uniref:melanopsin-A-like n=1 Tax=Ruditapes philippinarum TaxID=129788 RepID=UPI00295A8C40|nr:melanopsin-A-like [Ruditapes philippinarum]